MFSRDFKEKEDRVVIIKDMTPETMTFLLRHIHQHDLPKDLTVGEIVALLTAADRFNVRGLWDACELLFCQIQSSAVTSEEHQSILAVFILGFRLKKQRLMKAVVSLMMR